MMYLYRHCDILIVCFQSKLIDSWLMRFCLFLPVFWPLRLIFKHLLLEASFRTLLRGYISQLMLDGCASKVGTGWWVHIDGQHPIKPLTYCRYIPHKINHPSKCFNHPNWFARYARFCQSIVFFTGIFYVSIPQSLWMGRANRTPSIISWPVYRKRTSWKHPRLEGTHSKLNQYFWDKFPFDFTMSSGFVEIPVGSWDILLLHVPHPRTWNNLELHGRISG